MHRHLVDLAAFLMQPEPRPAGGLHQVLEVHTDGGRDAGEAVDHHRDQGPVAQADQGVSLDGLDQALGLGRR